MEATSVTVHIGSIQVNPNDAEPELHFASREFDNTVVHEMEEFLGHELSASEGLVLVVIDRWQLWFRRALHATMPGFPLDILYDIESYDERVQSSASLPVFNRHDQSLSFVMDHIDIFRKREGSNRNALDLGTCEVRRQPLATWICPAHGISAQPDRPLAVMVGVQSKDIMQQLTIHYFGNGHRRWNRLSDTTYWLYLDLFAILTRWDKVWDVARGVVSRRESELQARTEAPPIIQQARALHQDTATNIALREHIRVHRSSLSEYQRGIGALPLPESKRQELLDRVWIITKALEHYEATAITNLEQLQNLLSLTFNMETLAQGQNVSRLNMFAFFFLPLSYVASIFGITTMTAPVHWYPAAAVGALLLTASAILGTGKIRSQIKEFNDRSSAAMSTPDWTRAEHLHNPADLLDVEKTALAPPDTISMPIPPSPTNGTSLPENLTEVEVSSSSMKTSSNTVRIFSETKTPSATTEDQALNSFNSRRYVPPLRNQRSRGRRSSSPPLASFIHSRIADINMTYYSTPLSGEDERGRTLNARPRPLDLREPRSSSRGAFLMRRSIPSAVNVEQSYVRRPSPSDVRFRREDGPEIPRRR